jgi:DNA-binding MarR family transcriptional regulator
MTLPNDLAIADYQTLADFRHQIRRFLHFSEEAARHAGLEPQHHQLMLAVKGSPHDIEPRIGYLADRLQIHHHSAVELVDRLARRGLIRRSRSEKDRREVHVRLTAKGECLLKELTLYHRDELRTAAPTLASTLKKIMTEARSNHKSAARRPAAAESIRSRNSPARSQTSR